MMALPRVPKRLRDLVDAACDDTITADGSRELEGILRRDDEARQYYLLYFHMVSHVRINVVTDLAFHEVCQQIERQQQLEQSLAAQPADEPAEKEPVAVDDGPPPLRTLGFRTAFSREIRFAFLVATVVVVAILGVLATLQVSAYRQMAIGTSASQAPVAVAHLARQLDATWQDPAFALHEGQPISLGEKLQLATGLVEVVFQRGTKVTVEGPATFLVTSDNSGELQLGRLVARVPEKSLGFTLETPQLTLVDLGTEFGVEVDPSQESAEVYVFEGVVEASVNDADSQPGPDGSIVLQNGEALRCEPGRLIADAAAVDPRRFVRTLPWKAKPVPHSPQRHRGWQASYAELVQLPEVAGYWSFDDETLDDGSDNQNDGTFMGRVGYSTDVPARVGGGRSLLLNGSDGYVTIPHSPSLVCTHSLTVAFWMKGIVAEQPEFFARPVSKQQQIGWEFQVDSGLPRLSVRIDTNEQSNVTCAIGEALDGRWHHVAVVLGGGQVRTYFDGVQLFVHEGYRHGEGFAANETPLLFGVQHDATRGYCGLIDEVIVFRGALPGKEIRKLVLGAPDTLPPKALTPPGNEDVKNMPETRRDQNDEEKSQDASP